MLQSGILTKVIKLNSDDTYCVPIPEAQLMTIGLCVKDTILRLCCIISVNIVLEDCST